MNFHVLDIQKRRFLFYLFALNYLAHAFHLPWIAAVNLVLLRRAA